MLAQLPPPAQLSVVAVLPLTRQQALNSARVAPARSRSVGGSGRMKGVDIHNFAQLFYFTLLHGLHRVASSTQRFGLGEMMLA